MSDPVLIGPLVKGFRQTFGKSSLGVEYVSSADLPYVITNVADEDEVRQEILSQIPSTYETCNLDKVDIDKQVGETAWEVTAHYTLPPSTEFKEAPDKTFAFDFGTQNANIKYALSYVNSYGPKSTEHTGTLIGWDGKTVKGVDILFPVGRFSETHWFTDTEMSAAFRATLLKMVGKINSNTFRGFAAGEVLISGITGSRRGDDSDDPWELTFNFDVSENKTGLSVGSITGIAKKGWQYLDVRYEQETSTTTLIAKAVAAKVLNVYDSADFDNLGIG